MELVSIRLHRETVERLRALAREEAVRRNENVTWASIVRELLEQKLLDEKGTDAVSSVYPL